MSQRSTIYICDNDSEFRHDLISQFATSIEDHKLVGITCLDDLFALVKNMKINLHQSYIIINYEILENSNNQHCIFDILTTATRNPSIEKIILYASEQTQFKQNDAIKQKKISCVTYNDFTFYRIQNIIRNCSNLKEYNRSKIGLIFSFVTFVFLSIWFYSI